MWQNGEKPSAKSRDMDLLVKKALELGHKPTFREVEEDSSLSSANAYAFHYGSFSEAADVAWAMAKRRQAEHAEKTQILEVEASAEPGEARNGVPEEHRWLAWLVRLQLKQRSSDGKLDYYYVKKYYPFEYQRILLIVGTWQAVERKLAEFGSTDYLVASKGLDDWLAEMQKKLRENAAKKAAQAPQKPPRKSKGGRPRKQKAVSNVVEASDTKKRVVEEVAELATKNIVEKEVIETVVKNTETEVAEIVEAPQEVETVSRAKDEPSVTSNIAPETAAIESKWSQERLIKELRAVQIIRGLGRKVPSKKQLEEHLLIYGSDGPKYKDFLEVLGPKKGWGDLF